ncbi:lanthionine synthetase LanC family protein [Myxococcaceae bacterium GXIMD 01537]
MSPPPGSTEGAAGSKVGAYEVLRCVQSLEDAELYEARAPGGARVALKWSRPWRGAALAPLLEHEAAVLRRLEGDVAPRLLALGVHEERPFLVTEWCAGTPMLERLDGDREAMLRHCCAVLDAYARLHARGVLHGDIHPGHIRFAPGGQVRLLEFGRACMKGGAAPEDTPWRWGAGLFLEPESARALLARQPTPPPTEAGEQYALAALVYLLLRGLPPLELAMEGDVLLKQVAEAAPNPFSHGGGQPWPEVEAVLLRALSKEPWQRFPSVAELSRALRAAQAATGAKAGEAPAPRVQPGLSRVLSEVLRKSRPGGEWYELGFPSVPSCSVAMGAAGLAYTLARVGRQRQDAKLLTLAGTWLERARARMGEPTAFYRADRELTPKAVGPISLLYTASGVHTVRAMLADAQGDAEAHACAAEDFVRASSEPCSFVDLAVGRSGTLLGCALLLEARPSEWMRSYGDGVQAELWSRVVRFGPVGRSRELTNLGLAHGWAGLLYATLRWCAATRQPLPESLEERLYQLAGCAEYTGRGLRWRWTFMAHGDSWRSLSMPGWCNGGAGYVFLWTLAHRVLQDARWLRLAEQTAWSVWEGGGGPPSLCCGLTGRAYALLDLHRATGDAAWLSRALRLGEDAARLSGSMAEHPASLFKGEPGLALLFSELETPLAARLPFLEER